MPRGPIGKGGAQWAKMGAKRGREVSHQGPKWSGRPRQAAQTKRGEPAAALAGGPRSLGDRADLRAARRTLSAHSSPPAARTGRAHVRARARARRLLLFFSPPASLVCFCCRSALALLWLSFGSPLAAFGRPSPRRGSPRCFWRANRSKLTSHILAQLCSLFCHCCPLHRPVSAPSIRTASKRSCKRGCKRGCKEPANWSPSCWREP